MSNRRSQPSTSAPTQIWARRRLIRIVIVGLFAVAIVATWSHYRFSRPVGAGPAGSKVLRKFFDSPWSHQEVVVLGLGDSVTQGLGASTTGKSYFQRLIKNPDDEFPDMRGICLSQVLPKLTPLNLAISGTTSIECVDYQLPKLTTFDDRTFGVVVMTTGGNDVIHNYGRTPPREGAMYGAHRDQIDEWLRNFESRLEAIADKVQSSFPGGCHIFIANIYDPTDGDGDIIDAG